MLPRYSWGMEKLTGTTTAPTLTIVDVSFDEARRLIDVLEDRTRE